MKKIFKAAAALLLTMAVAMGCAVGSMAEDTGEIFMSSYFIDPSKGNTVLEVWDKNPNNVKKSANGNTVYLTICDSRVDDKMGALIASSLDTNEKVAAENSAKEEDKLIRFVTDGSNYSANWKLAKNEYYDITYTNGSLVYTIVASNVNWYGDSNDISVNVIYNTSKLTDLQKLVDSAFGAFKELKIAGVKGRLSEFVTKSYTSPAPEPTATPEPTPTPTPEPNLRTSGLIVRSTSIGGTTVEAGDDFTLSLEIYATASGTENLCDVLVAINPADGVTLASGSSTQYIGTMAPGASANVTFPMHAQNSFTGGTSTVSVSLSASGEKSGSPAQATGTNVTVPVIQPERFEISKLEVPDPITAGEENFCTITFVNKGKNAINNLTLTMTGSNLQEAEQSEYVGNLAAGTEKSVDFNLCALEPGQVGGVIALEYEDSTGQQVLMTQNFGTNVEEAYSWDAWEDPGMVDPMPEEEKPGLPWWAWAAIVIGVMGVGTGAFVFVKKRRAKAAAEALDEDF